VNLRIEDNWKIYCSRGNDDWTKTQFRDLQIADLKTAAETEWDQALKNLKESLLMKTFNNPTTLHPHESTEKPDSSGPASSWDLLRSAFIRRLELFELQGAYDYYRSCPAIGDSVMLQLLKDVLDAEFKFGGVCKEELIRVFRTIYPYEADRILPRTAAEMREQVNSLIEQCFLASAEGLSTVYIKECHEGSDVAGSRSTSTSAMIDPVYTIFPSVFRSERTPAPFSLHVSSDALGYRPSAWSGSMNYTL
jgi:hypothetical protein